jgi:undecaprenyl-diphosphatase
MAVIAARGRPGAIAAFAALTGLASAVGGGWLADADRALFEHVRARRGETGTAVARRISALAELAVVYPVLALAGWEPCLVVASGTVARRWLSQVIARPHPPEQAWLADPEGFSLPSRHTTIAALAAGACVRAAGVRGGPARAVPLLAAAAVGASRV